MSSEIRQKRAYKKNRKSRAPRPSHPDALSPADRTLIAVPITLHRELMAHKPEGMPLHRFSHSLLEASLRAFKESQQAEAADA